MNFLVNDQPVLDRNNKHISVYDKSQIVILSDHGFVVENICLNLNKY